MARLRSPWLTHFLPGLLLGLAIGWAYGEWLKRTSFAVHQMLEGMQHPVALSHYADIEAALDAGRLDLAQRKLDMLARTAHWELLSYRCYQEAWESGFLYWPPSMEVDIQCFHDSQPVARGWRNPVLDQARTRLEERIAREAQQED